MKHKVAFLISHPTQYHTPLFRELAKHSQIDLTVYFCSKIGLGEHFDKTYGRVLKWDTPLLEGYNYAFLKKFLGLIHLQIFGELKKNKYDVLIVHGYNALTYWLAFFGAWFTKTPLILKGEADLSKKISAIKQFFKKIVLNFLFKRTGAFLYSYSLNKEFFKIYGVPEEKLFFCPSAVDNNFFQKKRSELRGQESNIKKEYGIKNSDWSIILFVGQFIPRKRLTDLLEAAKLLAGKIDFNILFIGDGEERGKLIDFAKKNNLDDVYFLGFKNQSELPKFYSIADIFVLPSEYDPSPKALNEAFNFELPVIASDGVKTAPDLVLVGECGFVYPAGNVSKLAENIHEILKNDSLRAKFGRNALETVSKWSYEEDVKGIAKAIQYVKS